MQKNRLTSGHHPAELRAPTPPPGPQTSPAHTHGCALMPSQASGHTSVNRGFESICRAPLQGPPTSHQPAGVSYSSPARQTLRLFQISAIPEAQSKINWLEVTRYQNVRSSFRDVLKGGEMFQDTGTGICLARHQSRKSEAGED